MKIINNCNSNKAQGYYMISIEILKLCGSSLCKHLSVIFNSHLRNFLWDEKKPMWFRSAKT